ncbi:unnamed protein product, partial [Nesidiocoris tenuis]
MKELLRGFEPQAITKAITNRCSKVPLRPLPVLLTSRLKRKGTIKVFAWDEMRNRP